jgi:hypothetical protein
VIAIAGGWLHVGLVEVSITPAIAVESIATPIAVVPAAASLVVALLAFWVPRWTLFALGQVALVAVAPRGSPLEPIAAIEAGLFVLLLGDRLGALGSFRSLAATLFLAGGLGALAWGGWGWFDTTWGVALVVAAAVAVAAYGLHRYERLQLGYLEDYREPH